MINLSIIIPVYNDAIALKRLLESIPVTEDIEILVIDDNSTENIEELDATVDFGKERFCEFKFFTNTKGVQSAGACRNIGLENATGKWLMFADSDDYFVEGCFDMLRSHFDDDEELIYFKATSVDEISKAPAERHFLYNRTISEYLKKPTSLYYEMQLRYKCNGPVAKMIRRDVVKKNDIWFDQVIASNDEMFSTKCGFYCKRMAAYDDVVYCITSRPGSLITNVSEEKFWIRLDVFIRKYTFLRDNLSKREFQNVDLSSQEKIIALKRNGYSKDYCKRVVLELKKNRVQFVTVKTFDIGVLILKVRLFFDLQRIHRIESKYESY